MCDQLAQSYYAAAAKTHDLDYISQRPTCCATMCVLTIEIITLSHKFTINTFALMHQLTKLIQSHNIKLWLH